jgi:hypothetical protein
MKNITSLSLALIMFSAFYFITTVYAQAPGSAAAGHMNQGYQGGAPGSAAAGHMNQAATGSAAAGHMNQGYQGGAPGSAAAGHMNQAAPGSAAATGQTPNPRAEDCSMFPGTGAAKAECLARAAQ